MTTTPHCLISIPQALAEAGENPVLRVRVHRRVGMDTTTLLAWAEALVPDADLWVQGLPAALAQVPEPDRSSIARQLALGAVMRAYPPCQNTDAADLIAEYIGTQAVGRDPLNEAKHLAFIKTLEAVVEARRGAEYLGSLLLAVRDLLEERYHSTYLRRVLFHTFQVKMSVPFAPGRSDSAARQMEIMAGIHEVRDQFADLQAILTSGS